MGGEIRLATKRGRQIPNDRPLEQNPARLRAARDMVLNAHGSARLRSLTGVYNCVGMVFASRRTSIEPDELQAILEDDEDRRLSSDAELVVGDLVVYRDSVGSPVHVGLVSEVRVILEEASRHITVLSQWGKDGEYFHRTDDVSPLLGSPTDYWTDRK